MLDMCRDKIVGSQPADNLEGEEQASWQMQLELKTSLKPTR